MYDAAVIGIGAMGSGAAYELAQRGKRVIGLEQFQPGHNRGSSHGESRAFRLAHFEGRHYCELARHALSRWRQLEQATGEVILAANGVLECGPDGSRNVRESLQAAVENDVEHELLSSSGVAKRFPAFRLPSDWRAVFQTGGGFLRPERAIHCFTRLAQDAGADLRFGTKVLGIEPNAASIILKTDAGSIEAGALIVTAGPWIGDLVPQLAPHLTLTRQVQFWLRPQQPHLFSQERFPAFALEDVEANELCYGFPDFAGSGVKVSSHDLGQVLPHADAAAQDGNERDAEPVRHVLARYIPLLDGPIVRTETCIYTNTADGNFVIDRHPDDERIVLASACSGHGFKYASAIGEILADLAIGGQTPHDIAPFSLSRLAGNSSVRS